MLQFKKCVYVDDLLGVTFLSCLGSIFILIPPFNETLIRIPLAFFLFFFAPGYAFISAFFPGKREISGLERFVLSIGFSIVLVVFSGFSISLSPWDYRSAHIVISIMGITTIFNILAIFTRKLLNENEQFSFSIKEYTQLIKSDEANINKEVLEEAPGYKEKGLFNRLRSVIRAKDLKSRSEAEIEHKFDHLEIEKMLVICLIVSIVLASSIQVYAKLTQNKEAFTALYLLGPDGKAEGYPNESLINIPLNVTVGIENHELQDENYILQMKADEDVIEELNVTIKDGKTWQKNMTYMRQKMKAGKSKLEFALYKEKLDNSPYREVHIYINNKNTMDKLVERKYIELPAIENGDMESSSGWVFISNTDKITGSRVNNTGIDSSYAYRIVNSYEGYLSNLPEYGGIYQNITCSEKNTFVLSAYVNSSSNSSNQELDNQVKQIIVNGETVWAEGINGNKGWQHIEVPITLQEGNNNLMLNLNLNPGKIEPVEVIWDDVSLKSIEDIAPYALQSSIMEAIPPVSSVLKLQNYTDRTAFNVSWNGTDDSSGIAYYSIDYSTDGINWKNWIPKATYNSSIFTGENNETYYFRSRAVDNSGNEEPVHTKADTQIKVFSETPQIKLDISPNPCKSATTFTVTYPLPLKSAVCLVTPDGFESESVELTSTDGFNWAGTYKVKFGKHFNVEAICTDVNGNPSSTFDEFTVDNSMPDFLIEISPKTIDVGELEVKVTPLTALKSKPSVSISANKTVNVTYTSYSEGIYYYEAEIDQEINEGEHTVSVTGYDLDNAEVKSSSTFVISHSG